MKSLLCLFLAFAVLPVGPSAARNWYVTSDGTGDAPTIQAAIDSSTHGDHVVLADGTYTGQGNRDIDLGEQHITVRSESLDPQLCIIDCQGSESEPHRGFYIHAAADANTVLAGITVENGCAPLTEVVVLEVDVETLQKALRRVPNRPGVTDRWSAPFSDTAPAAPEARQKPSTAHLDGESEARTHEIILPRSLFDPAVDSLRPPGDNASPLLRALLRLLAEIRSLDGALKTHVELQRHGGGILCLGDGNTRVTATIVRCNFVNNLGGGAYVVHADPWFIDCGFLQNAGDGLHGEDLGWSSLTNPGVFRGCVFKENDGHGLYLTGVAKFTDCVSLGNSGSGFATGLDSSAKITRCDFSGNHAGAYLYSSFLTASECSFSGNSQEGLRLTLYFASFEMEYCEFSENGGYGLSLADGGGRLTGCVFVENEGPGVLCAGSFAGVSADDCDFLNNGSTGGSGAGVRASSTQGSGITLSHCRFLGNTDQGAGAVYSGSENGSLSTTMNHCAFVGNNGTHGAIGIVSGTYATKTATIDSCVFVGNRGTDGGAVGITRTDTPSPIIVGLNGCTFYQNSAARGGAIYNSSLSSIPDGSLTLDNCTLYGNSAQYGGAIFSEGAVTVGIQSTIIAGSVQGEAVSCETADPVPHLECCDLYGNSAGDWVGPIGYQYGSDGNFSLDPLFCHPDEEDFRLDTASPCLPANNACGVLIGAHDEGCLTATGIDTDSTAVPRALALDNHPNPFNPATRISYAVPMDGPVEMGVYDVTGRLLVCLVSKHQRAGEYVVEWNADDFPSGIYFCRLGAGGVTQTLKLVLLK